MAVAVEVNVPNIAIATNNGSPMAKLARMICPEVLELRKITCPTPVVETSTISCIEDGVPFFDGSDDSSGDGVVVENHDNWGVGNETRGFLQWCFAAAAAPTTTDFNDIGRIRLRGNAARKDWNTNVMVGLN